MYGLGLLWRSNMGGPGQPLILFDTFDTYLLTRSTLGGQLFLFVFVFVFFVLRMIGKKKMVRKSEILPIGQIGTEISLPKRMFQE